MSIYEDAKHLKIVKIGQDNYLCNYMEGDPAWIKNGYHFDDKLHLGTIKRWFIKRMFNDLNTFQIYEKYKNKSVYLVKDLTDAQKDGVAKMCIILREVKAGLAVTCMESDCFEDEVKARLKV